MCLRVKGENVPEDNLKVLREAMAPLLSLRTWEEPFGTVAIPKTKERPTAVTITKHGHLGQPGASGLWRGPTCVADRTGH